MNILFNQFDKYGFNIMTKKISKTSLEEVPYNENTKRALSLSTENKLYPTTSFQAWKHYFNPINYFAYPTLDQDLTITIESKDIMSHLFLSNSYTRYYDSTYSNIISAEFTKYTPSLAVSLVSKHKKTSTIAAIQ